MHKGRTGQVSLSMHPPHLVQGPGQGGSGLPWVHPDFGVHDVHFEIRRQLGQRTDFLRKQGPFLIQVGYKLGSAMTYGHDKNVPDHNS